MAKTITPDALIAGLKRWGAKYVEYPGWRDRSRPRDTGQRRGGLVHHTGGGSASPSYLYFLFVKGRPEEGIPGPLCNVATAPDGTLHLGASGRANHAGQGSQTTLDHLTAEDYAGYTTELEPGPDNEDGNDWLYGNELIYSGKTPPTAEAYHAALVYAAVICEYHGWSALSWAAHREWTDRKDDPYGIKMYKFRTDLAAMLKAGPPNGELTVSAEQNILAAIADLKADIYAGPRYQALQNSVNAVASSVAAILPYLKSEDTADDAAIAALNKSLQDLKAALPKPATPTAGPTT